MYEKTIKNCYHACNKYIMQFYILILTLTHLRFFEKKKALQQQQVK
jgi:hypothetical protein